MDNLSRNFLMRRVGASFVDTRPACGIFVPLRRNGNSVAPIRRQSHFPQCFSLHS